ncbi:DUF424 domain-containing protein [Thermogladius sp.]|uniref:DUF424 domain-containing protein n=1 Tax=Thermogladius sp. TaxID=2023064 RepID=UPI003D129A9A
MSDREVAVRVYVKTYNTESGLFVAACDEDVLGLRLVDESRGINFYVDPSFFKGEVLDVDKAVKVLRKASMANIVGNGIVGRAVSEGLVREDTVLVVNGVKVAMFITL